MPITASKTAGNATAMASALIGDYQTLHVKVDVSALATKFVTPDGYLKPNVPLSLNGLALTGAAGEVPSLTVEPVKIAASNGAGDLTAARDIFVSCAVSGVANRDVIEDTLGTVLSAAEIAALNGPNSKIVLSLT